MSDAGVLLGSLSTLISATALVAVAVGIRIQTQELRLARMHAFHTSQLELIRLSLENPVLPLEFHDPPITEDEYRNFVHLNWRMRHLEFGFIARESTSAATRMELQRVFNSATAQRWWLHARSSYVALSSTRRQHAFLRLVTEEFDLACTRDPARSR
jgi:hypothetical protein